MNDVSYYCTHVVISKMNLSIILSVFQVWAHL